MAVAYLIFVRSVSAIAKLIITLALLAFSLAACETDRYRWNLAHAENGDRPPITPADFEKIVRVVTRATVNPVLFVHRQGRDQVCVAAGASTGYGEDFILAKTGSEWHIVSHEQSLDR